MAETKTNRKTQYSAPALEKGLDILELLSLESDGLNVSEIAQRLQRSVGELFRMLVVLEQRGYVSNLPSSDKYILSLKMFNLSHRFPPVKRLTSAASAVMKRLSMKIEQSCHLVIYYEGKGHVVVQQDSPSERMFSVRLGAEAPLINTCSGHLLLAYADLDERNAMLEKIPSHHKKSTKKALKEMIATVLDQGYESISSGQAQGVQDIGYPVFDYTGRIAAALVMPYLTHIDGSNNTSFEQAQKSVAAAAEDISVALGYEIAG
ncbi:IclR family transcriptional regulator [Pseudoteredinibacter isoporae]|uniref:DNA-binding IclR family transcriptional regulator n=1 Tax=Pseudoteredinibacter isoporae TaxID=570281 RepID=A0A7X0JUU0_9GAMM|nr:IclR family transcriptional regulator [Pseudoteredinibacter isoporae]MBB6522577.1 DNA-binding IclR family transcriptional regulator [Pseudoteredinibacter isoporae]NHO88107.1 IclR family transcriptional regulator [Pseudoteredinibacter isoporae]NIB23562.1 IclR family transcriptional regulator [Pseudoteredinibacter isoporae]